MQHKFPISILLAIILAVSIASAQTGLGKFPLMQPDLWYAELTDLDGQKFNLADFYQKVIVVNLWAEWLGPCRNQMPELIKMQKEYSSRGFEVIGIHIGGPNGKPQSVRNIKIFADTIGVNYYLGQSSPQIVTQIFTITKYEAMPQTIVIGRDGTIRGAYLGAGDEIERQIRLTVEKALSEPAPLVVEVNSAS